MNKTKFVHLFCNLNSEDLTVFDGDFEDLFAVKVTRTLEALQCTFESVAEAVSPLSAPFTSNIFSFEWKFICLNFYILELIDRELSACDTEVLSVQEARNLKDCLRSLSIVGILRNVQPNLPHHAKFPATTDDVMYSHNLLKCTIMGFHSCIKRFNLRMLILPNCLQGILVGIFQIAYCPLRKPSATPSQGSFVMTDAIYKELIENQDKFKEVLNNLRKTIHPSMFLKELMLLNKINPKAPVWFTKSISRTLTKVMHGKKGVQQIVTVMLGGCDDDTTKTWQAIDVLTKLVITCRKSPFFVRNICAQVTGLLDVDQSDERGVLMAERLFVSCTKSLYTEDKELCRKVFVRRIIGPLQRFTTKEHKFRDEHDVTDDVRQATRVIYGSFVNNSLSSPCLPTDLLDSVVNVVFHFYCQTCETPFQETNKELGEILERFVQNTRGPKIHYLYDAFLFGFDRPELPLFRDDILVHVSEKIIIKYSKFPVVPSTESAAEAVFRFLKADQKIVLFGYLLNCVTERDSYFTIPASQELMAMEENPINRIMSKYLAIHQLLVQLSEDKAVQTSLRTNPEDVIYYFRMMLENAIKKKDHRKPDTHFLFVVVMVLEALVHNQSGFALSKFRSLMHYLSVIRDETPNSELRRSCDKVAAIIRTEREPGSGSSKEDTELDKILRDLGHPQLPVRGHALMMLGKLVKAKDECALERKQYILNLMQLSLKDEDSYIYLIAIQGLAAMADVFPDTVLQVLCEEFGDRGSRHYSIANKLKLGEVLVKTIKQLGEMAPKYKSLLLNTFLATCKDDDEFIRASSLSNLGETCRILGYKLGTIVSEVLVCVNSVIATDKAPSARRAAVAVLRKLIVGLEGETINFLKEEILPIYRTLKQIYLHDQDQVMKLQAQLAIEELDENVKKILFTVPPLHKEKKVVILN